MLPPEQGNGKRPVDVGQAIRSALGSAHCGVSVNWRLLDDAIAASFCARNCALCSAWFSTTPGSKQYN